MSSAASLVAFFALLTVAFCQSQPYIQTQHLGTWTTYAPQQDSATYTAPPATCAIHTVAAVLRHGNRNPTSKNVKLLSTLATKLASSQPNANFAWLKNWKNPFPSATAGQLVASGQRILYDTGKRFQKLYPTMLNVSYNPDAFPLRSTYVTRVSQSAQAFAYALFEGTGSLPGGYVPVSMTTGSETDDRLLRFYDACQNLVDLKSTPVATQQLDAWIAATLPGVAAKLSQITGIANLTSDDANALWTGCQAEVGVFNKTDGLCTLFDEATTLELEYGEDIDNYYATGYGFDLNWQSAAPLLQEITSKLVEAANVSSPLPRLYFGHAETVIPLVSILGLFKDSEKLMANSSAAFKASRKYSNSVVAPFGATVTFVLYKCSGSFQIRTLVNEKEVVLPGCPSVYCPLPTFLQAYKTPLSWSFEQLCTPATAAPTTAAPTTAAPTTAAPTTQPPTTTSPPTSPPAQQSDSRSGTTININFANLLAGYR